MLYDFLLWIAGFVITGIYALIGWQVKMLHSKIETNEKNINEHKLYASNNFSTKLEADRLFSRIMDKLDKIEEKIDRKADK